MITAVTLALTLAFEPPEGNAMRRPPRDPREPILSRFLMWRIIFVSLILLAGTFGLFVWEREHGASLELARTVAVNTLVMFEVFYLLNVRYLTAPSLTWDGLTDNRYVLLAISFLLFIQMHFTYLPAMQALFGTTDLGLAARLRIVRVAAAMAHSFVLAALLNARSDGLYLRFRDWLKCFEQEQRPSVDQPIRLHNARMAVFGMMSRVGTGAYDAMRRQYGDAVIGFDFDDSATNRYRAAMSPSVIPPVPTAGCASTRQAVKLISRSCACAVIKPISRPLS